jgi:hypothetical protein
MQEDRDRHPSFSEMTPLHARRAATTKVTDPNSKGVEAQRSSGALGRRGTQPPREALEGVGSLGAGHRLGER